MNASSWPMFLLRTLSGAEMAPASAFKKVMVTRCENHCDIFLYWHIFKTWGWCWTFFKLCVNKMSWENNAYNLKSCVNPSIFRKSELLVPSLCVCTHIVVFRNHPVLLKTTSSLVWSWRRWTGRTPTWFVRPQWEKSGVRRYSSCLMAGEVPLIIGAPLTPETSSPWAGAPWRSTAYSRLETSVSAAVLLFFMCERCILWPYSTNTNQYEYPLNIM